MKNGGELSHFSLPLISQTRGVLVPHHFERFLRGVGGKTSNLLSDDTDPYGSASTVPVLSSDPKTVLEQW